MFNLTHSQYDIWNSQSLAPNSPLYNENIAVSIFGDLDVDKLEVCWQHIVQTTPALRTRINYIDGVLKQTHDGTAPVLEKLDFSTSDNPLHAANEWMHITSNQTLAIKDRTVNCAIIKIESEQWIWFIQQHHIAVDAWSMSLIWNTLVALYESDVTVLPPAPSYSYPDFLNGYSARVLDNDNTGEADHWRNRADAKPLPLYGRCPGNQTVDSTREIIHLSQSQIAKLDELLATAPYRTFNKQLGLYQLLLSVFIGWLSRIASEKNVSVNMPFACRQSEEEKRCVGYFIELLPFSVNIPDNASFEQLYKLVQEESMRFIRNAQTGASQFKGTSRHKGTGTSNVFFNFITGSFNEMAGFNTKVEWISVDQIDPHQALRAHIVNWQSAETPEIAFDFNNEWFNDAQRQMAIEHFQHALRLFTEQPNELLDKHSLVGTKDIWKLTDGSTQYTSIESGLRVEQEILAICEQHANIIAVVQNDVSISYAELAEQTYKFAYFLNENDVVLGDRIILHLDRCWELVPAILGTLLVGAVYVPIDRSNPQQRIRKIEKNAEPKIIVTTEDAYSLFASPDKCRTIQSIITRSTQTDQRADFTPREPFDLSHSSDSDNAYILYTSGSTGEPKGVSVSSGSLRHFCNWTKEHLHKDEPLVFPLVTSISFDITAIPLFVSLLSGGCIHVYPNNSLSDATSMIEMINNPQLNTAIATPSQFSLITGLDLSALNITQLIVLGEDFKTSLAKQLDTAFKGSLDIYNGYGPTEATIACFIQKYDRDVHQSSSIPIGQPLAGMEGLVLNEHHVPQVQGSVGELYLSGPLLGNGYWKDREKTDSVFINLDLFPQKSFYKTGDLVRVNELGALEYLGRNDNQVKRNGVRIELGEIEGAALAYPDIRSAAASLYTEESKTSNVELDPNNSDQTDADQADADQTESHAKLVLYYNSNVTINDKELSNHLTRHLSDTLMPDQFIWLESIPLNVNGKTDYGSLPKPGIVTQNTTPSSRAAESELERLWVDIWLKYLNVSNIDIADNFFRIGGNSLLAIKIISDINAHGYCYKPTDVFRHQTIILLANLDRKSENDTANKKVKSKPFSSISSSDLAKIKKLM